MNTSPFIEEIKKVMDFVRIPIAVYDPNNDITLFINKSFIEEIGYTTSDIPNYTTWFLKAFPDEHYRNESIQTWEKLRKDALAKGESHVKHTVRIYCRNGVFRWYEIHMSVVGYVNVLTCNNVDKLYIQNERLTAYNEQIEMMLSIISHDVRTPLGVLKNLVDSYSSLELTKEETESLFLSISEEINKTFQLINAALLWISSNNETFSFHKEEINLYHFFAGIQKNYIAACKEKNIALNISGNNATRLCYDIFILEVVARNIINNAIKYCFENCTISVTWQQSPQYTDIFIKDDGPGMSIEKVNSILMNLKDPDKQNGKKKGFGVGLKLINQCLKKYYGELIIESEINKGSEFIIRIRSAAAC